MKTKSHSKLSTLLITLAVFASGAQAGPTQLANSPLSGASSVEIAPNIMFVLDDSGSMDWPYLPDWAGANSPPLYRSKNPGFNGVAYNPAITYSPPKYFNADGSANTTAYPSQTGANTANWTSVKNDGYGVQNQTPSTTSNLIGNAYYYSSVAGEYCTNKSLKTCVSTPTPGYPILATLRWCKSAAEAAAATPSTGACQATQVEPSPAPPATPTNIPFNFPRIASPRTSVIEITGVSSTSISSVTVGGSKILSVAITASTTPDTLASDIESSVNACTFQKTGACDVVGFRAIADGNKVTLLAPNTITSTPSITKSGSMTVVVSAFSRPNAVIPGEGTLTNQAPGENLLTVITSTATTYPKAASRTDCSGADCGYAEEMTNYANWWAYYRTRMQSMKTATSLSFEPIGNTYRVGYMTINNNTTADFLNIKSFTAAQKHDWYNKVFAAKPVSTANTPLRVALAKAGRLYAGELNSTKLYGIDVIDPVQYFCQQNVTILSTDGYWNEGAGFRLDGATLVGNQDSEDSYDPKVVRPQLDGGGPTYDKTTTQITQTTTPTVPTLLQMKVDKIQSRQRSLQVSTQTQPQAQTSDLLATVSTLQYQSASLQSQTSQLQTRTRQLQQRLNNVTTVSTLTAFNTRTSQILKSTKSSQAQQKSQKLQYKQSLLQTQISKLQISTATLQSATSLLQTRTAPLQQRLTQVQQRTSSNFGTTWSGWSNVASCTPKANETQCKLLAISGWNNVSSCTPVAQPYSDNPHTLNAGTDSQYDLYTTVSECQYGATTGWSNVSSCTPATKSSGSGTWSVGTATDCQYTAWSPASNAPSCTPVTQSSGSGTWSVATATNCSYTAFSSYTDTTSTCTPVAQSSGSGTWSVTTAVQCQYGAWGTVSTGPSCTPVAKSTTSPYTVTQATQCSYAAWNSSWQNSAAAGSCTPLSQSSGTGTWSGPAMQCRYNPTIVGWTNVASCTKSTASDITNYNVSPAIVDCQTIDVWSAPTNAASCTINATTNCSTTTPTPWAGPVASCTPGTSGTGLITECQAAWTTPVVGACTPSPTVTCGTTWGPWTNATSCSNDGTTSQCQYLGYTGYSNVNSPSTCTVKTADSGAGTWSGPVRDCIYSGWTAAATDSTCNSISQNTGTTTGNIYSVNIAKQCSYGGFGAWTNASSTCTAIPASTGNPYVPTATNCQYDDADPVVVNSCTPVNKSGASPYATLSATACSYSGYGAWSDVASCTNTPQSTASPYSGPAVNCQFAWTPFTNTSSCLTNATTQCQYGSASWVTTPEGCTLLPASSGSPYTVETATVSCKTTAVSPWADVGSCTEGPDGSNNAVTCQTLLKPATSIKVPSCSEIANDGSAEQSAITCSVANTGPTKDSSCKANVGSSPDYIKVECAEASEDPTPDTLADVAQYYYMTDLRDSSRPSRCAGGPDNSGATIVGNNVCTNDDKYPKQFMSTYTLGLGASGLMQYQPNYLSSTVTSGDFYSVKEGLSADPLTGICPWQDHGKCNWPKPESNTQTNIDDLWHAAVNGRGTYFSATDPLSLAAGISGALSSITVKDGSLAAVTVTSPNLAAGDNGLFAVSFTAGEWSGDVTKLTIDISTGEISSTPAWSAQSLLDTKVSTGTHTARKIYTLNSGGESISGAADNLRLFVWDNLSSTEKDFFNKPNIGTLSQFCSVGTTCLSSATQTAASGEPLLQFIRGDATHEGTLADLGAYYRQRKHILGDIVGSEPIYVKGPIWNYADYQYGVFKTAKKTRTGMVYVAANDGMLHALNASSGEEEWAYVPSIVMPSLYKLADKGYSSLHQFLVDGTPAVGDICASDCSTPVPPDTSSPVWKTILVGGLNKGGRGYYALDITDPAKPIALWEYTDDNLGYTYGNPVISKLKDGTWVVMFTSGYNNISPGDGLGRLFVLNANTGDLIRIINTTEGDSSTPSGLSRISAWANFPDTNNTAQRVYGGDLGGNLWRFDVNGDIPSIESPRVYDAQRLATLKDSSGAAQPISSRPELGRVQNYPVVFVATGQLLGTDDLATTQTQSVYAIKERLTDADFGDPRTYGTPDSFVGQTLTADTCSADQATAGFCTAGDTIVTGTNSPVDFTTNDGWYIDFPVGGERVNTDLDLQLGTLVFNTNTPKSGACVPVGLSYEYYLDYRSGAPIETTDGLAGIKLGDYLSSSASLIRLVDGSIRSLSKSDSGTITPGSGTSGGAGTLIPGSIGNEKVPTKPKGTDPRRISWRELITE